MKTLLLLHRRYLKQTIFRHSSNTPEIVKPSVVVKSSGSSLMQVYLDYNTKLFSFIIYNHVHIILASISIFSRSRNRIINIIHIYI